MLILNPQNRCIVFWEGIMSSFVDLYVSISGQPISKLRKALTPFCPEGSLPTQDDAEAGELSSAACKILMKALWLGRLARPDIIKPIEDLATCVQKWSRNNDRQLASLTRPQRTGWLAQFKTIPESCILRSTSTLTLQERRGPSPRQGGFSP